MTSAWNRRSSSTVIAYLIGAKLLLRYLLDIPARLKKQRDNRVCLGTALVARLRYSMQERDIPLWLNTPIVELITAEGKVCGAVVKHEGKAKRIRAHRGVLLGTGGFSHNVEMRQQYQQAPIGADWTAAAPGATGDAVSLGKAVGADLGFMGRGT